MDDELQSVSAPLVIAVLDGTNVIVVPADTTALTAVMPTSLSKELNGRMFTLVQVGKVQDDDVMCPMATCIANYQVPIHNHQNKVGKLALFAFDTRSGKAVSTSEMEAGIRDWNDVMCGK